MRGLALPCAAVAAAAGLAVGLLWAGGVVHATSAASAPEPLRVGMQYVIPPFVGGSKVRTPAALDAELAQAWAKSLGRAAVHALQVQAEGASRVLASEQADAVLAYVPAGQAVRGAGTAIGAVDGAVQAGMVLVPTGYESRPMAILRSDTDIKSWQQLQGRTVCVAEGGRYAGWLASQYGAHVNVMRAPADSLLALRVGTCDAAVHDEAMLRPLLKLPEWKKFSATLPPGPAARLVFMVRDDAPRAGEAARALAQHWRQQGFFAKRADARARDIAFEVYLDQNVPDCH